MMIEIGFTSGELTVIEVNKIIRGYRLTVACSCGQKFSITQSSFLSGKIKRCKQCHDKWIKSKFHLIKDRTNEKHGLLTVIKMDKSRMSANRSSKGAYWICRCECGNTISISNSYLHKKIASCGCTKRGLQTKKSFRDPIEASWMAIYLTYKKSAETRRLPFNLSLERLKTLCSDKCYYCGEAPYNEFKLKSHQLSGERVKLSSILYNGIDRVNNDKGYTKDNVVTCCKKCNYAKLKMSLNEFKEWITKVYKHLIIGMIP